jgi:nucleotide-binding universal stress UspA family protein
VYKRIVVPLDGSPLAEQALTTAAQLAEVTGASLHLVRVVDFTRLEGLGPYAWALEYAGTQQVLDDEAKAADEYLAEVRRRLGERGLNPTYEVRRGRVVGELAEVARPDDLVVMASHGRTGLARWFLGSVAEEMLRHSTVPVLLVRVAGADGATATPGDGKPAVAA